MTRSPPSSPSVSLVGWTGVIGGVAPSTRTWDAAPEVSSSDTSSSSPGIICCAVESGGSGRRPRGKRRCIHAPQRRGRRTTDSTCPVDSAGTTRAACPQFSEAGEGLMCIGARQLSMRHLWPIDHQMRRDGLPTVLPLPGKALIATPLVTGKGGAVAHWRTRSWGK